MTLTICIAITRAIKHQCGIDTVTAIPSPYHDPFREASLILDSSTRNQDESREECLVESKAGIHTTDYQSLAVAYSACLEDAASGTHLIDCTCSGRTLAVDVVEDTCQAAADTLSPAA